MIIEERRGMMKLALWVGMILIGFGLVAAGCANVPDVNPLPASPATKDLSSDRTLTDFGPAPELTNTVWVNTDQPLRLKDLRGKVVLIDMWTFGCINCQHVIPSLKDWYARYKEDGLVVIGNHYPEFDYEKDLDNLQDAVRKNEILYPVAQDNDGATWSAYQTRYWPTLFLIDKQGQIRYMHIGEGNYEETEAVIQTLLAQPDAE